MDTSDLAIRMKNYEKVSRTNLMKRTPVAIRIDGKAFHTFTRGFHKPFDVILIASMQETMKYLCSNIQGCVFGYTQSDEITLILTDYATFDTSAWFDNEVQKICSISASMATMKFNSVFNNMVLDIETSVSKLGMPLPEKDYDYIDALRKAADKGAMFDSRCFNIPKEEVVNLVYWRQLDASRNSIQMVGQANFSHTALQGKSCNDIQDMLIMQKNINWNNFPTVQKRGTSCIKTEHGWELDFEMPILIGENREYLEKLI